MNIITSLEMAADAYEDRVALTCGDRNLDYTTLQLAASHNMARSDRVMPAI
jgi:non-ribosomal peptide synthetase component E (peptide arylation enzyme)